MLAIEYWLGIPDQKTEDVDKEYDSWTTMKSG